eukprot:EG_transcript_36951
MAHPGGVRRVELLRPLSGDGGRCPPSALLPAGPADNSRRPSVTSSSSSSSSSSSGASFTHNPYSFDGPTYLPSPRSGGGASSLSSCPSLPPLGFIVAEPPSGGRELLARHSRPRRPSEPPILLRLRGAPSAPPAAAAAPE